MNRICVIFNNDTGDRVDLEIPTDVTADVLIRSLNAAFRSGKRKAVAIRTLNPISYLCGYTRVEDAKLHNGTELFLVED